MALVLADRVKETTTTTGTGTVTLAGVSAGYQSFAAIGNGNTTYYTISGQTTSEWEVGIGTYTSSGTTLSRTTVLSSSTGGSLVNFSAGTKDVFVTYPSGRSVNVDAANTVVSVPQLSATSITDSGNLTFTGTGNRITGDFTNATIASRVAFQSSTVNGNTIVPFIPNGTSTNAQVVMYNDSGATNASTGQFAISSSELRIASGLTGTGTYLPMTFYTGGSESVRIGSGAASATDKGTVGIGYTSLTGVGNNGLAVLGNVGIGTSSPSQRLTISDIGSGLNRDFAVRNGDATNYHQLAVGYNAGALSTGVPANSLFLLAEKGGGYGTVGGLSMGTIGAAPIVFINNGAETARIDSSGNVGIGTNSPGTYGRFAVVSNGDYAPSATFISNSSAANWARADWKNVNVAYNGIIYQENGGSFNIRNDGANAIVFQTTATERMRIDASGNVGIGNSSPGGFRLNVTGSIYQTDGYATFGQYNAGTSGTSPVAGGISFSTNITSGNAESNVWNGNDPASYANTGILFTQRLTSTTRRDLVFMHNNGNVGIGTNSPAGRLDVRTAAGVVAQSNLYTGSNASVVKFNIGQIGAVDWDIGLSASSGNFYIGGLGGTMAEAYRITRNGAAIDFQTWNTGGSERMRIDPSGNVNIGSASTTAAAGGRVFDIYNLENTNSSSYALARLITYNVAGTTSVSADIFKNKAGSFVFNNNETNAAANTSFGVGGSERMRIDSSGNVGIGTSAPTGISSYPTVDIKGASGGAIRLGSASVGSYVYTDAAGMTVGTSGAAPLNLFTNGLERARINSSGNLLVGDTGNAIGSKVYVNGGTGEGVGIIVNSVNATRPLVLWNAAASGNRMVQFYTGSGPASAGSIESSGTTTTYNTSSDYRLKNITGPITNSGAYIDSLNPVEGTWKASGSAFVGLLAHEVQEASRTFVATGIKDGDEMQGMDYSSAEIIANLIAEIQSLRKRLAAAGI